MNTEITIKNDAVAAHGLTAPTIIAELGEDAQRSFFEFFFANIRNENTRKAYARAVMQFFNWCERLNDGHGIKLDQIEPLIVAAYIEQHPGKPPTVKQHLAAIRMLFDWLVIHQVIRSNPASSVRGPKYVIKKGKTPILTPEETRKLFDTIGKETIIDCRDRAIIAVMVFSFARISAVLGMDVEDYFPTGKKWWFRLMEKGGKHHEVPAHHTAEEYLDEYIERAGIGDEKTSPLFRAAERYSRRQLGPNRLNRHRAYDMIRRRARHAGLVQKIGNHTFRGTGITAYLENAGDLETAQRIAAHESPRTTKLYDRRNDAITLDEVERIII